MVYRFIQRLFLSKKSPDKLVVQFYTGKETHIRPAFNTKPIANR